MLLRTSSARSGDGSSPVSCICVDHRRTVVTGALLVRASLEPIREVWIYGEAFAASRLSMMRIMARRMNAATVVA